MDLATVVTADPRQVERLPPRVRAYVRGRLRRTLENDPFAGDRIPRDRWPGLYRDLANLFRVGLPDGHRTVYTVLTHPGRSREVRILWLGDHKAYDRLFGYATS